MSFNYLLGLEGHQKQQKGEAVSNEFHTNEKRKAIIIGISKYDHSNKFSNLDFCENDANEVYSILKNQEMKFPHF